MRRKYIFIQTAFILFFIKTFSQTVQKNWWVPNGTVQTIEQLGDMVYLGGNFTSFSALTSYGSSISSSTAMPDLNFATPNGAVHASAPDGTGGWYIGGEFTEVGGIERNRIAHINADGSLDSWNPNADSEVREICVGSNTVYASGFFTNVGGQARNGIAALDATTGLATNWNPSSGGGFYSLAVNGNLVYVGGIFSNIGGQPRSNIAALDASSGLATP